MFALVAEWESSGLGRKSFCEQHGLKLSTFSYWRSRYNQSNASSPPQTGGHRPGSFKRIVPVHPAGFSIELIYPNGVRMILPEGTDLSTISSLIHLG